MTDEKALCEKLDAMVAEKRNTDSVYVLQDVALDLLARLEAAGAPCVWTACRFGYDSSCGNSFGKLYKLETQAQFCPGCGHPVQVKQPQDAATKEE